MVSQRTVRPSTKLSNKPLDMVKSTETFTFKIVIDQPLVSNRTNQHKGTKKKQNGKAVSSKLEKLIKLGSKDTKLRLSMQKQLPNYQQRYQTNTPKVTHPQLLPKE